MALSSSEEVLPNEGNEEDLSKGSSFKGVTGLLRVREGKSSKLGERISGLLQGDDEEEENPELCAKLGTKVLIMRVFLRWLLLFLLS